MNNVKKQYLDGDSNDHYISIWFLIKNLLYKFCGSAEIFNVNKTLPAYLDPSLKLQDQLSEVSLASGGAGYDPLTAKLAVSLSL